MLTISGKVKSSSSLTTIIHLHVNNQREGEVLLLPQDGRQGELHPGGHRALLQGQAELQQAGHGGERHLPVNVRVGVQSHQALVVRQREDVSTGHLRTQTLLTRENSESSVIPLLHLPGHSLCSQERLTPRCTHTRTL